LFGSSRQLITGPDAATCILVAATLAPLAGGDPERYMALVLALTVITGLLYVFAGLGRLGFMANFLSQPILTGYLNGIALLIMWVSYQSCWAAVGQAETFRARSWNSLSVSVLIIGRRRFSVLECSFCWCC
jgi:MFS superfamily sulfate permease-like transporter